MVVELNTANSDAKVEKGQKILVLGGYSSSLINFRGLLLLSMVRAGHQVSVAAPGLSTDKINADKLRQMNIDIYDIPFERAGINPLADIRSIVVVVKLLRRIKPSVFLGYTIKPVIYGTIAASFCRVRHRYALITGLGYAFTGAIGQTALRRVVLFFVRILYKLSLARANKVFFQNPDDEYLFRQQRLMPADTPSIILNGSGVDLDYFAPTPFPDGSLSFLLIARLLGDKGIREYAQAAEFVRNQYPLVSFHLVGATDPNPDQITSREVESWHSQGTLIWHGSMIDVRPMIKATHVYVLPSYREGTPRTVLEAMAMQRPIITTDVPGCRETVVDGENGFLVRAGDSKSLAAAMLRFIESPRLIEEMGACSRRIAEEKYDVHKVNQLMMNEMRLQ